MPVDCFPKGVGSGMKINVHNIGSYTVKNYLLETPVGIIAIDTGYPGGFGKFKERFKRKWPLSSLKYIFLTHHHDDHAGFLNELIDSTDATLILHNKALEYLATGRSNEPPGAGYSSYPASLFSKVKKDFSYPPVIVPVNRAIPISSEDRQIFEEIELPISILFLPGHTEDSIGLFLPETGQLFCGDAAMNAVISVARHTIWIEDAAAFGRSWDKMLSLEPKMIYPSHGTPFKPNDLVKYRHFLDGREIIPPRIRGDKV
jgi:glyoxylase-like metal-dependent hydrolase (beta-lactamase superfamily II)